MSSVECPHTAARAFVEEEQAALDRLYALATKEAERRFAMDDDAKRRLANMVVFTYRTATRDPTTSEGELERQLLEQCLDRFTPLQRAISRVLRRRRL